MRPVSRCTASLAGAGSAQTRSPVRSLQPFGCAGPCMATATGAGATAAAVHAPTVAPAPRSCCIGTSATLEAVGAARPVAGHQPTSLAHLQATRTRCWRWASARTGATWPAAAATPPRACGTWPRRRRCTPARREASCMRHIARVRPRPADYRAGSVGNWECCHPSGSSSSRVGFLRAAGVNRRARVRPGAACERWRALRRGTAAGCCAWRGRPTRPSWRPAAWTPRSGSGTRGRARRWAPAKARTPPPRRVRDLLPYPTPACGWRAMRAPRRTMLCAHAATMRGRLSSSARGRGLRAPHPVTAPRDRRAQQVGDVGGVGARARGAALPAPGQRLQGLRGARVGRAHAPLPVQHGQPHQGGELRALGRRRAHHLVRARLRHLRLGRAGARLAPPGRSNSATATAQMSHWPMS